MAAKPSPKTPTHGTGSAHQWRLWLSGLVGSRYDGLRHFAVVEPGKLLRCGQPHIRDLDKIRSEHGLATILCARGGTRHPLRGRWFRKERAWCERNGVQLVHIRMSDEHTPPAEAFDRLLTLLRDPDRTPVLVHCEQGFHRTGILCAAYRLAECGWDWDAALAEMAAHGFDPHEPKRAPLVAALRAWNAAQMTAR